MILLSNAELVPEWILRHSFCILSHFLYVTICKYSLTVVFAFENHIYPIFIWAHSFLLEINKVNRYSIGQVTYRIFLNPLQESMLLLPGLFLVNILFLFIDNLLLMVLLIFQPSHRAL